MRVERFIVTMLAVLCLALAVGCGGGGGGDGDKAGATPDLIKSRHFDLFPMQSYYQWFYNDEAESARFKGTKAIAGHQVSVLNHISGINEYFFTTSSQLDYYGVYFPEVAVSTNIGTQYYSLDLKLDQPITLYSTSMLGGSNVVEGTGVAVIKPTYGQRSLNYWGYVGYAGTYTVTTPLGTYSTHRIRMQVWMDIQIDDVVITIPFNSEMWLAEDIGVVQRWESGLTYQLTQLQPGLDYAEFTQYVGETVGEEMQPQALAVFGAVYDASDFQAAVTYLDDEQDWVAIDLDTDANKAMISIIRNDLPAGDHAALIKLMSDAGDVILIKVKLTAKIRRVRAPAEFAFFIDSSSTEADLMQPFTIESTGVALDWFIDSFVPWVAAGPQGTANPVSSVNVMLDPGVIYGSYPNGRYETMLTLRYRGEGVPEEELQIPVTLDVDRQ